jgi:hypothetical protein
MSTTVSTFRLDMALLAGSVLHHRSCRSCFDLKERGPKVGSGETCSEPRGDQKFATGVADIRVRIGEVVERRMR